MTSELCGTPDPRNSPTPRCLTHLPIFLVALEPACSPLSLSPGRCSIFPDLSFVTFDGSHAALFKEAIYILSQSPDEIISVHALDCKSANLV